MTNRQKRELAIKRLALVILAFVFLASMIAYTAKTINTNRNRYAVDATCELKENTLVFNVNGYDFIWKLKSGDKIPNEKVIAVFDSCGTPEIFDDEIVRYYNR